MKYIILTFSLSLLFACQTNQEFKEQVTQEKTSSKINVVTEIGDELDDLDIPESDAGSIDQTLPNNYMGVEWGTPQKLIESETKDLESIPALVRSYPHMLTAYGKTDVFVTPEALITWGFSKNKLVYGTAVYFPIALDDEITQQACSFHLDRLFDIYGPPDANTPISFIWQNEDTTLVMYCTGIGPVLDWYSTLWLRYKKDFIPYRAIPEEALNGYAPEKISN